MKNPTPLSNLIGGAVDRASIRTQIGYANAIRAVNERIEELLPHDRKGDAKAISIRGQAMTIGCLNSAAAHFLAGYEAGILDHLKERVPDSDVQKLITRVMARFPSSELH